MASRRVARAGRTTARAVHRPLLARPGHRGRARSAGLRDVRGLARPAVVAPVRPRRAHRPGPRPARRRARRGPGGPADQQHRADPDGDRHPHRAVPPLQGDRDARLRQHRARRVPDPRLRPPGGGRAVRAAHGRALPARGRRPAGNRDRRAVRRGGRLRRGRAPALGQLGGRRGDPGRRHRPVRRPREAALHRLRGPALQRAGALHHATTAAGPADRERPRAPAGALPAGRPLGRPRVRDAPRRERGPRDPRRDPRGPGRRGEGRRDGARRRRRRGVPRRRHRHRRRPQGAPRRAGRRPAAQRRAGVHRNPGAARRPGPGVAGGRPERRPVAPRGAPPRPAADHPRSGAGTAAPGRVPHRLRGRHPARAARPSPSRQPLRRPSERRRP